ncbi:MAG TPA: glycerol-3-phosphate dehydrogenase C-terminal domain-containing protein, partial [Acidimicrobiales bacterium]
SRFKCATKNLSLHGATTKTRDPVSQAHPLSHLVARYGTDAGAVRALAESDPTLLEPVIEGLPYIGAELRYAAQEEMARTLEDVLARRTRAAIQQVRPTLAAAAAAANLIAPDLGWTKKEAKDQASAFVENHQKELLVAGLDIS